MLQVDDMLNSTTYFGLTGNTVKKQKYRRKRHSNFCSKYLRMLYVMGIALLVVCGGFPSSSAAYAANTAGNVDADKVCCCNT